MISASVQNGDAVVRYVRGVPDHVRTQLHTAIGRLVLRLQRKVKQEKLSGSVLNVRTGTLRRSIDETVMENGNNIIGIVSTNVKYGRLHEYGFKGTEQVKQHLRLMKTAWGKPLASPKQVMVRQHSRKVDLPERSFLRSALNEMRAAISADIDKAIGEGVRP